MTVLCAVYDLGIGPTSYDFIVFMVKAKMAQRAGGHQALHVVIVPKLDGVGGMFRDKTNLYDEHEMRWRLWNILIPGAQLFDAGVTLATDWEHARRVADRDLWTPWPEDWDRQTLKNRRHLIGDVIAAARAGHAIPRVSASRYARRVVSNAFEKFRLPVVTMTLRSTYLEDRNSDPAAWAEARRYIEARGFVVVMIEDTAIALARGSGYGELNLDLRAAMYQEAALNLQANNGAASLCWFGDRPYRMFGAGVPAAEWDGLFVKQGLPLGESWPWAGPQQRIVYGKEDAEVITREFENWAASVRVPQ